jgi:flagellar hook-associated protein 1 FlgK
MSGLVSVLSIARDALAVQQYGMDVTGHNVANVSTEEYSRQSPVLEAKRPAPYANQLFGTGVQIAQITRNVDRFVEARLMDRKMELASSSEKEVHMGVLEGLFNQTSDQNLASEFSDFWNAWHDLANNPSGLAERDVLLERGYLLAQGFADLGTEMTQISREINLSLQAGVDEINELTSQLAALNGEIVTLEALGNTNDLRDQRTKILNRLAEYLDIKFFEHDDGGITVMTKSGFALADKVHSYRLTLEDNEVKWEGSSGTWVPITDTLRQGKFGGWLDMRDSILPKVQADLDELARSTIWEVNKIHTQGAGLSLYSTGETLTSAYATATRLGDLAFGDRVDFSGTFKLWIGDSNGENLQDVTVDLNFAGGDIDENSTLAELRDSVNAQIAAQRPALAGAVSVAVSASGNRIEISSDGSHTFGFSEDSANLLAALGIHTFFTGSNATGMKVNPILRSDPGLIAAGRIDATTGEVAAGDGSNALAMADLQSLGVSMKRWSFERGAAPTSVDISDTPLESFLHALVSSIGLQSQSIQRAKEYNELLTNQLTEARDSVSAVSLDEEMTEMIKYQHAYSAAAKLISTADEMLRALIEAK